MCLFFNKKEGLSKQNLAWQQFNFFFFKCPQYKSILNLYILFIFYWNLPITFFIYFFNHGGKKVNSIS